MRIPNASILTIIFLLILNTAVAQNKGVIKGKVVTNDGVPAFVTVQLRHHNSITVTDENGIFSLENLPPLEDTLMITAAESKTIYIPVSLRKSEVLELGKIREITSMAALQDIEILGRNNRTYKSDYSFLGTKTQTPYLNIPQSISSVTDQVIKDKMQFTLKDAISDLAGVSNYSGYDEYTIRGFRAENARLVNGLRGYSTSFVTPMLLNVERIEVIKGPAATLYGNSDPGGTINLVTKKPLAQNNNEINVAGGSWDHYRVTGDFTGPLDKKKTFLYRLNAGYDNTKSFRNQYFAKSYQVAPSFSFVPSDRLQLNVDFNYSHFNTIVDRGQPGFENDFSLQSTPTSLSLTQPGDFLKETDFSANVLFSYKFNNHISFNTGYLNYQTDQKTNEHGLHSYITDDSVDLYFSSWKYKTTTNTITNYLTFHFNTGKFNHQLVAGFDYIKSSVRLDQEYFENADLFGEGNGIAGTFSLKNPQYFKRDIGKYEESDFDDDATEVDAEVYHTSGAYVQEQLSYNRWKLLVGVRQEMYRSSGGDDDDDPPIVENVFLPRVGLVYSLKTNVSLYATYNRGFDPFEASTSTQEFDEPFKPIVSELYETGIKASLLKNKLNAALSIYQLTVNNVAVNANDLSNPDLFVQQGKDRSRGFETEFEGNILPNLSAAASYAFCIAKVIQSKVASQEGALMENAPKHVSTSWIKYSFRKGPLKNISLFAGHTSISRRNTLQPGFTLPGYIILNGGVGYKFGKFSLEGLVNNITNKTYWQGAYNTSYKWPGAPINMMVNIGYRF